GWIAEGFDWDEAGLNLNVTFLAEGTNAIDADVSDLGEVHWLAPELFFAAVEPGEIEQRLDQAAHLLGRIQASFEAFAVFGRAAFAGEARLNLRDDDAEGRAEFVRGVGGELFLLLKGGFKAREGRVQHRCQVSEFIVGLGNIEALRQIASRTLSSGTAEVMERATT